MQYTGNYNMKKPEGADNINIQDINDNIDILDAELKKVADKTNLIQTAGGTATVITLNNVSLVNGFTITFVVSANNSGAATTINGKALYKPGGTAAPTLSAGKAVTVWYNGTNFFIKASAEGTAAAGDVLAGKTFSSDADTGLTGTMPNRGSVGTVSLTTENSEYTIPAGYHNGVGKVKATIAGLVAGAIKAGSTVGGIAGTFTADANAATDHVIAGKTAYVNGTKITGTMPDRGSNGVWGSSGSDSATASEIIGSGVNSYVGAFDLSLNGKYSGTWRLHIANLISENIKAGVRIGRNIPGCYIEGSYVKPYALTVQTFIGSTTWTVPAGVNEVWAWIVSGGGGGGGGISNDAGSGGGGGYCVLKRFTVTPWQQISVIIGAGGAAGYQTSGDAPGSNGGASAFAGFSVPGGQGGGTYIAVNNFSYGGAGTGGGGAGYGRRGGPPNGGNGSTGGDGGWVDYSKSYDHYGGKGSYPNNGICPFDTSLICGGGGGGGGTLSGYNNDRYTGGDGGDGGGGHGGGTHNWSSAHGSSGANEFGGGGGGGGTCEGYMTSGGSGGSGRIMVAYYV